MVKLSQTRGRQRYIKSVYETEARSSAQQVSAWRHISFRRLPRSLVITSSNANTTLTTALTVITISAASGVYDLSWFALAVIPYNVSIGVQRTSLVQTYLRPEGVSWGSSTAFSILLGLAASTATAVLLVLNSGGPTVLWVIPFFLPVLHIADICRYYWLRGDRPSRALRGDIACTILLATACGVAIAEREHAITIVTVAWLGAISVGGILNVPFNPSVWSASRKQVKYVFAVSVEIGCVLALGQSLPLGLAVVGNLTDLGEFRLAQMVIAPIAILSLSLMSDRLIQQRSSKRHALAGPVLLLTGISLVLSVGIWLNPLNLVSWLHIDNAHRMAIAVATISLGAIISLFSQYWLAVVRDRRTVNSLIIARVACAIAEPLFGVPLGSVLGVVGASFGIVAHQVALVFYVRRISVQVRQKAGADEHYDGFNQEILSEDARVAILMNFVPPYRIPVFSELERRVGQLKILVNTEMEGNRQWDPSSGGLDVIQLRTWTQPRVFTHPAGFKDVTYVHVPLDTNAALVRYRPDVVIASELGVRTLQAVVHRSIFRQTRLIVWATLSERTEVARHPLKTLVRRLLVKRADAVIVNGQSGLNVLQGLGVPRERVHVGRQVCDPMFLQRPRMKTEEATKLLYVGQLIERKGIVDFVRNMKGLNLGTVILTVVGVGPLADALMSAANNVGLRLHMAGGVPPTALPSFYEQADFLLMPSLADEWGLVVNEAFGSGVPVVGSIYSQAVTELVVDGVTGWTFKPDEPEQALVALRTALSVSGKTYAKMSQACFESASRLTVDAFVDVLLTAMSMNAVPVLSADEL